MMVSLHLVQKFNINFFLFHMAWQSHCSLCLVSCLLLRSLLNFLVMS